LTTVGEAALGVCRMGKIDQSILLLREKHIDFLTRQAGLEKTNTIGGRKKKNGRKMKILFDETNQTRFIKIKIKKNSDRVEGMKYKRL
jgi:hypothetical protein